MSAIVGPIVGAGASAVFSKILGGGGSGGSRSATSPLKKFKPVNIRAGGLTSSFANNTVSIASGNARIAEIDQRIAQLRGSSTISAPSVFTGERENELGKPSFEFRQFLAGQQPSGPSSVNNAEIARLEAEREQLLTKAGLGGRPGLVSDVSRLFREQAGRIGGLLGQVRPGFGGLTEARRSIFEEQRGRLADARRRTIGNVRENLGRRRILGSSFAQDAEARVAAEFAKEERSLAAQEAEAKAQSFLQELELTNNLINQQFDAFRSEFQTQLDELNLQTDVALQLATGVTSQMGANARLLAELNAQSAAGSGQFFGQITQPISKALGEGFAGLFDDGFDLKGATAILPSLGGGISPTGQISGLF